MLLCGPAGEQPTVYHDVDACQAERLACVALAESTQQALDVLQVVHNVRLQPYIPPTPVSDIGPDNVHFVCTVALVP